MTLQTRIPWYVVVGRIAAVLGMSGAIALGIFVVLAGKPVWGLLLLAAALPFAALIFLIERVPGGADNAGAEPKSARPLG